MALDGNKLGKDIAKVIYDSNAPSDVKSKIEEVWIKISSEITKHITKETTVISMGLPYVGHISPPFKLTCSGGSDLGTNIAKVIYDPKAPSDVKSNIETIWKKIANEIVNHITTFGIVAAGVSCHDGMTADGKLQAGLMQGAILGPLLANCVLDPGAPADMKTKIIQLWTNIANEIVGHLEDNAEIPAIKGKCIITNAGDTTNGSFLENGKLK